MSIPFHSRALEELEQKYKLSDLSFYQFREFMFEIKQDYLRKVAIKNGIQLAFFCLEDGMPFGAKFEDVAIKGDITFSECDSLGIVKKLSNPTWLDIWKASDEIMLETGDESHIFVESITKHGENHYVAFFGS